MEKKYTLAIWNCPIMKRRKSGFTLIELLITLSVIAIITCCSVSYFYPTIHKNKTNLIAADLLHHLQYARSQAIKTNQIITLCGSQDAQTCSSDWSLGYLITTENNKIIKTTVYKKTHNLMITGNFNNRNNIVRFTPSGKSKDVGRIVLASDQASEPIAYTIMVSHSGRSRFA